MRRDGKDNHLPTSDAGLTFQERDQVVSSGDPLGVDAGEPDVASEQPVSVPRTRIGRPPRLTPVLAKHLVAAVRRMGWLSPAARACGVPENVVAEWVSRGRGTHPTRPATSPYAHFAQAIEKAQADWEASKLALIDAAAQTKVDCWTAAAWQLERHAPERYGRRDRLDVGGSVTVVEVRALLMAVVQLVERYVPPERREAELADLATVAGELAGAAAGGIAAAPALARGR
jgi:hypothetical protein